jgi:hypothetical protein
MEVEEFRSCVNLQTLILKLLSLFLIRNVSSHFESHVYLNWESQSSPTYICRSAHAILQFIGSGGDNSLD